MPGRRRGSATTPAIALAAAVNGEARNVRPPLPWRPSKLRLLVLTAYWPGRSWSPFIAMHIEQPDSRHSAPAALKISDRPSASASRFTSSEPGTTISRTPSATWRSLSTPAASRRSLIRPLVQLADEDDIDLLAEDRLAGLEVHVLERALERAPLARVGLVGRGGDRGW